VTARIATAIAPADCQHDAVAAALLHDIGVLVLLQQDPVRWEKLSALAGRQGRPVHEAERALGGTSHAKIGGYLLALWGLPQTIVEAVAYHHDPSSLPGRNLDAVAVVHIADALACEIGADLEGTSGHCSFDCEYVAELGAIPHLDGWREEARTIASQDGFAGR
jgi:HD-like signal output (HDOD) protein